MAKRTDTQRRLTRRQIARREREARMQRLITYVAAGVGIVVFLVLIFGVVSEITQARRPVVQVGEEEITTQEFERRQKYERWMRELEVYQYQQYLNQLSAQMSITGTEETGEMDDSTAALTQQLQLTISSLERQLSPDLSTVFGGEVLDNMIEEEIIRQEAESRGLSVTEDEVQQRIELMLGYDRDAATQPITDTETVTDTLSTPLEQPDFDQIYGDFREGVLEVTRYPEDEFLAMVRANVLREHLQEDVGESVSTVQEQVQATIFSLETEEEAAALRERINEEGEDPADLVESFQDEESSASAYELPWLPIGYLGTQFSPDLEDAAFNMPVGRASEPILGVDGRYYVVYPNDRGERELSADLLAQAEEQAYQSWLAAIKEERVEYFDWEDAVVAN